MAIVAERRSEYEPIKTAYRTSIEAIMDIGTENQDSAQLLRSLECYLDRGSAEKLTLNEYNRINRELGKEYVNLLTKGMYEGKVRREDVLRVNKKLSEFTLEQYKRITSENPNLKTNEQKLTDSEEEWLNGKQVNKNKKRSKGFLKSLFSRKRK